MFVSVVHADDRVQQRELRHRTDSLTRTLHTMREQFRTATTDERNALRTVILRLESDISDTRSRLEQVTARIAALGTPDGEEVSTASGGEQPADLVRNDVFRRLLRESDYAALLAAQAAESKALDLLQRYLVNYDAVAALAARYAAAGNAADAEPLYADFLELDAATRAISDSLGEVWSTIFDNKSFSYNYLLQRQNRSRELARLEAESRNMRGQAAQLRDGAASGDITDYLLQKLLIFSYEQTLADILGLRTAADSLRQAAAAFRAAFDSTISSPPPAIVVEERSFIDFADLAVHSPARYNAANPIPELTVYRRGVVYRVMLGSYTARQAVSVFRGLYPLAVRQDGSRWVYYGGTIGEFGRAKEALALARRQNFRNAQIVVWVNGAPLVLDDKPTGARYRVEIGGIEGGLPDEVREAVTSIDSQAQISRSGAMFIVGPFGTSLDAEEVAAAVRTAVPSLSVRTVLN